MESVNKQQDIINRVKHLMETKGISYGELAKVSSYSKSSLQRYFTGQTKKIPLDLLEEIAPKLGVSTQHLMGWDTTKYNWETDQEGRISAIPHDVLENLLGIYEYDIEKAWNRWWDICAEIFFESINAQEGFSVEPSNIQDETDLLISFRSLNEKGRELAIAYVKGLVEVYKE